ncbi:hypothetical protein C8A01DRAFT_20841 [Parachaetomium inaequale]|uniref:Uncharacterized protein n=1 Tax=Parachaetomium inaequale TaxID=2588326 RepID=A0AAN6SLH1_9PEZI|nr:hypothetical protein C8A01DRAFT_20841 [Parachaetomium inaequale]
MDKVKRTVKKGLEKVSKMDEEPRQEDGKDTLETTWPTQEQHTSMTGGPDQNSAGAAHPGDLTSWTGKDSVGQPGNKPPRPSV